MRIKTYLVWMLSILFCLSACKQNTSEEPEEQAEEIIEVAPPLEPEPMVYIDQALDPLVIGKEFSNVIADTLGIQMVEFTMKPGDSIGLHEHYDHAVYTLQGGKLKVYFNGTDPVDMELKPGMGFVSGPLKDAAVNIGDTSVKLLITEVHRPRE